MKNTNKVNFKRITYFIFILILAIIVFNFGGWPADKSSENGPAIEVSVSTSTLDDAKDVLPVQNDIKDNKLPEADGSLLPISQNTSVSTQEQIVPNIKGIVNHFVPFIVQAPTGNWEDLRQEDGCEEASALMAVRWSRGEKVTASAAALEKEITDIADFESKNYGFHENTSASSTAEMILKKYFKFSNYELVENIKGKIDIIKILESGKIVIAPMNGKALKNPYFSNGGPDDHMLVIKGYDYRNGQFITNDPGTKRGADYRYDDNHLFSAIRDYTTGIHSPAFGEKKNILVISKE